ncbi:MAG TPA: GTPase HflX [Terrimicrobiaceae bacterium]|nr:GTPase HflX [Terrimicrobiaceae bacterium]
MMRETTSRATEKTILIGLEHDGVTRWDVEDSLSELRQLAATAGALVIGTVVQKLDKPTAPFYIGKGKAEEVARQCGEKEVTSLIFDDELSPAQGRNLEQLTHRKVLDRTQVILDIFARRARTREGRLQIELAQLQYLLPRLTRMWTHLSRQSGGIGTRGPGETQLEVDRRRVQERIARLERDLREVRKHRTIQREGRLRRNWPVASLIGYTNAGKSSLLNRLTGAGVVAEDKLFATLDPTTRQLVLPNRQKVLLTDTVGFIRKLPHTVIESFKATLEEVQLADLLIHVVDLSHPQHREQMAAVEETIAELGAHGKQQFVVFNKIDRISDPEILASQLHHHPGSAAVSARTGDGMDAFLQELAMRLDAWRLRITFRIPAAESALLAEVHRVGHVLSVTYEENTAIVTAHIPPELKHRLAPYEIPAEAA